jgi:DNA polymerase III sliding clamp (beta) subunit (PCNA family)
MIINYKNLLVAKVAYKDKPNLRPYLQGVLLEKDGSTVATDGHRLAMVTAAKKSDDDKDTERFPESVDNEEAVIVPSHVANELAKTLKSQKVGEKDSPTYRRAALVACSEESVEFQTKAKSGLSSRLGAEPVDGNYPPWESVIPKVSPETHAMICVDAKYLLELARMALDFGNKRVKLAVPTSHESDGYTLEVMVATCESKETGQTLTHVLMPCKV